MEITDKQVVETIADILKVLQPIRDIYEKRERQANEIIDDRAKEFVNKYPNLFTEDKNFWVEAIGDLLAEEHEINKRNFGKCFYRVVDMEEAFRAGGNKDGEDFKKFINNYD
jgi:hypothetical protein